MMTTDTKHRILTLARAGTPQRTIARTLGIGKTAVQTVIADQAWALQATPKAAAPGEWERQTRIRVAGRIMPPVYDPLPTTSRWRQKRRAMLDAKGETQR